MRTKPIVCAVLVWVFSSIALGQVYVDYNHGVDFAKFKTYAWGSNPESMQGSILMQNAEQEINSQLVGKGLQMVQESQHPDLIIVTKNGMKQQTSYDAWGSGGWRWGGGMASITPETEDVGTLVVDIFDANAKQMIWRGMAQDTLSTKSSKNEKKVDKDIEKMFKQFP